MHRRAPDQEEEGGANSNKKEVINLQLTASLREVSIGWVT
jgi:hypothetical protein